MSSKVIFTSEEDSMFADIVSSLFDLQQTKENVCEEISKNLNQSVVMPLSTK